MVEQPVLTPRGVLDPYRPQFARIHGEVEVEVAPLARQYDLRATGADAGRLEDVLGVPLPGALNWAEGTGGLRIAWLGPDEWLVIDPACSPELEQRLRLAAGNGAVVEQSGQRTSVLVTGDAAALLAKGSALELRPAAFPRGTALQGFLGQAVVVFLSRETAPVQVVEIVVRTSFARYVADWLLDALRDPLAYPAAS